MSATLISGWCVVCARTCACGHLNPPDRANEDNETRLRRLLAEYENRRMGRCDWCGSKGEHEPECEAFHPDGTVR